MCVISEVKFYKKYFKNLLAYKRNQSRKRSQKNVEKCCQYIENSESVGR